MIIRSGRIDPTTRNAERGPIALTTAGAAIEPMATAPIASPRSAPVRASTSRWDDPLEKRESRDILDAVCGPDDREQEQHPAKYGWDAMRMIGTPRTREKGRKGRRAAAAQVIAPIAPISPPTPIAAVR
jgi:hypothetical protein